VGRSAVVTTARAASSLAGGRNDSFTRMASTSCGHHRWGFRPRIIRADAPRHPPSSAACGRRTQKMSPPMPPPHRSTRTSISKNYGKQRRARHVQVSRSRRAARRASSPVRRRKDAARCRQSGSAVDGRLRCWTAKPFGRPTAFMPMPGFIIVRRAVRPPGCGCSSHRLRRRGPPRFRRDRGTHSSAQNPESPGSARMRGAVEMLKDAGASR